jgi:hypothetical protein
LNSIADGNSEKGEKSKRKKKKKIIKKKKLARPVHQLTHHNHDEIFKTPAHYEDLTKKSMNEHSFSVASEFGGGFCYHLDDEEEIKQEVRK